MKWAKKLKRRLLSNQYLEFFLKLKARARVLAFLLTEHIRVCYYILYMTENDNKPKVDRYSLNKIVEASTSKGKIDVLAAKKMIERLKGSTLTEKRQLLQGTLDSVDLLLANPSLMGVERIEISKVRDTLQTELDSVGGPIPPEVSEPGAQ